MMDVAALATFALVAYWSCQSMMSALPALGEDGVLHAWIDYYIHGAQIAEFGDPLAAGRGSAMMVDAPRGFYHYGVFMLPAAFVPVANLPGLGVATAIFLPLGLVIALAGIYAFCAELSGCVLGVASTVALALIPDPSSYWLRNGFFGFHWLIFTSPASGYAIGVAGVALMLLLKATSGKGDLRVLAISGVLLASLVMIRAHMFLLAAPSALVIVFIRFFRHKLSYIVIAIVIAAISAVYVIFFHQLGHYIWMSERGDLLRFLHSVFQDMEPTAYPGLDELLRQKFGSRIATMIEVGLVLVAALGIFALLFPLAGAIGWFRGSLNYQYLLLGTLIGVFACLVVFAPQAANGDVSEYKQRHFVLLYAIVGAGSIALIARDLIPFPTKCLDTFKPWGGGAIFFAAVVSVSLARPVDLGRPAFRWGSAFYDVPVDECLVRAAMFMRQHSEPRDVFAIGGPLATSMLVDPSTIVVSLSDIPAYLGRPALQMAKGGATRELAMQRAADIRAIDNAPTWDAATQMLRLRGIRWYMRMDSALPASDPKGRAALMRCGRVTVYQAAVN
ncbi:hypothetical protein M3I53_24070 [Paraburkholderia sp. CNPSo 3272]|uniref:hypothetical protein n=1 Tax=Paraburkholderia sp. CNPSo 3272 TaxID=2940931 RepID=UPI0020B893B4|nr:hypothetical protein [Paraburkholderia sp. CNPSo 3272]MCP3726168.1 hypothetical protein [Paraburkholderia sp. CNPSo 3272]